MYFLLGGAATVVAVFVVARHGVLAVLSVLALAIVASFFHGCS